MGKKIIQGKLSSIRKKSYFYLLINTLCWGAALVFVKPAFEFTTAFRFLFYRYLIAGLLFSVPYLYIIQRKSNITGQKLNTAVQELTTKQLFKIISIELLGTVFSLSILFFGLAQTSAIEASLIGTTGPVFITLAGVILLKEKQEGWEWVGLAVSLLGSILIVTTQNSCVNQISLAGNLLVAGFNVTNALYFILAKKYYARLNKTLVGAVSFLVGLVSFLIINLVIVEFNFSQLTSFIIQDWQFPQVRFASIYMGIFGSVIGLISYIKGQDKIEASEASLFTYLQPLVYLPLGILLLSETVSAQQILSLFLVLLGVLLAEKRVHR